MSTSIYTIRVQGADGRIVPSSFKASSRAAAENMALARGYDVIVSEDAAAEAPAVPPPDAVVADEVKPDEDDDAPQAAEQSLSTAADASVSEDDEVPAALAEVSPTSDALTQDHSDPLHPGAPWAWGSWLLPLLAVSALVLLGRIGVAIPDGAILAGAIALAVILPIPVGIILGIVAIRKARRSPRRQGLAHGVIGLVLGLILAVPLSAALLLPILHTRNRHAALSRIVGSERASLPQRMDAQRSVIAYGSRHGALVRTVLVAGEQPVAHGLTVAAKAHRIAVEASLAASRPDLVRLLSTRRIRLIDDLTWADGSAPAITVEFTPQTWVAAPMPAP